MKKKKKMHEFFTSSSFLFLLCVCRCVLQVQLVSGASPLAYWVSAYLWDVMLFFVLTVLVMLAFAAYGRDASKVCVLFYLLLLHKVSRFTSSG